MSEISVRIRRASASLIKKVAKIKTDPALESGQVAEQLKTIAEAVVEVANHCADLDKVLETLLKNVKFTKQ